MSRRARQHAEIVRLCRSGALRRALDLAYQHVADFGPDDELAEHLSRAFETTDVSEALRARFAQLRDASRRAELPSR